jgi:hypothetical protein
MWSLAKFYRIYSRIRFDNEPPKLIIGGPPEAPTGFTEKFSEIYGSQKRAREQLKYLRKKFPFGEHRFQELEIDEGIVVKTNTGIVVTGTEKSSNLKSRGKLK